MMRASTGRPAFDSVAPVVARVARDAEVALQVHAHHRVPLLLASTRRTCGRARSRRCSRRRRGGRRRRARSATSALRLLEVGDVGAVRDRLAAGGADLGDHLARPAPRRPPRPSSSTPRSFTTTFAPWRANSSACARPMPRAARRSRSTTRPVADARAHPQDSALEDRDVRLAAALAHGLEAVAAAGALELVRAASSSGACRSRRSGGRARSRRRSRSPCAMSAVELLLPREHHRRERLVDLDRRRSASSFMPAFASAWRVAGIGAVSMKIGSSARTLMWCTRARGVRPCSFTARSEATSSADAPSRDLARHRRGEPSARAQRLQLRHLLERGVAARALVAAARRRAARSRASKRPSSIARSARWWLSSAKRSMSSREMSHFSAIISAPRNCDTSCVP